MPKTLRNIVLAAAGATLALGLASGLAHAAAQRHSAGTPARMYGNPAAAAPYWRQQSFDDCALMATADVIGQLTGRQPSEQEIIGVARRLGSQVHPGPLYSTGYGTDPGDIPVLLAQYGIYGVLSTEDPGMAALERYLAGGHKVIAGVNAELIWGMPVQTKDNRGNPMSDHAVVVTGVDLATGKVHLNDSASPNGPDETVSIEVFERAWATGNEEMVVTRETA
jgi:hypothetical protein